MKLLIFRYREECIYLEPPFMPPYGLYSFPHFTYLQSSLSSFFSPPLYIRSVQHIMEVQGGAVLDSILRPHLSLGPEGVGRMQGGGLRHSNKMSAVGTVQPAKVVSLDGKKDHKIAIFGEISNDPNSGGTGVQAPNDPLCSL